MDDEWTVVTSRLDMIARLDALKLLLQERFEVQTKATDVAFVRQETAMQTALTAADKAVQAALSAAEKATIKAETAANERFAATNEFRGQLQDQAQTFATRLESNETHRSMNEKIDLVANSLGDRISELLLTVDKMREQIATNAGSSVGEQHNQDTTRANRQIIIAGIAAFLVLLGIITTVYLATGK